MEYPKHVEIPVPWGKIAGQWWGPESSEPIVFIHGWQDNLGTFDRLIPLLPPGLPYFAFDLPGHGLSSHHPKGMFYYVYWDGLICLRRMAKYFKWRSITVIGHSLGGGIGFLYASSFPSEIKGLISLDIACPQILSTANRATHTPVLIDQFLAIEDPKAEANQRCCSLKELTDLAAYAYGEYMNRSDTEILMKRGTKSSPKDPSKFMYTRDARLKSSILGLPSLDLMMDMASRITCKYLNIKTSDAVYPDRPQVYKEIVDEVRKSASSCEFHELKGTHHIQLNDPKAIVPLISNFLSEIKR